MSVLRDNPGVAVWVGIFGITTLVGAIVAVMMRRRGLSLRPVVWFAGLIAIIGVPQLTFYVYDAASVSASQAPASAALDALDAEDVPDASDAREAGALDTPEHARSLFGPDVDPALVSDARALFVGAQSARMAVFASGESVMLARFASAGAMERAWIGYLAATGLTPVAQGNSETGFAATRPAADRVYVLPMRTMLGVWTGRDDSTIRARMAAGGFVPHRSAPLGGEHVAPRLAHDTATGTAEVRAGPSGSASAWSVLPLPVQIGGLALLVLLTSVYFLKGAAWAGATPPAAHVVAPTSAAELRGRLFAVNDLDVPFRIEADANGSEISATWRYADAKWIDLARAHGMRRVHRVAMSLDERDRAVRVRDFAAEHDWSAGAGGARFAWRRSVGITFFHYEHQRVFGLQVGPDGRFRPALTYEYTFDLQEMKEPLIAAVTQAGWSWKPVVVDGPRWLRWLTE